jgi:hypothetical protein
VPGLVRSGSESVNSNARDLEKASKDASVAVEARYVISGLSFERIKPFSLLLNRMFLLQGRHQGFEHFLLVNILRIQERLSLGHFTV